jgi:hypothetical protein
MDEWQEIKQSGSQHYKTGSVELIDLFKEVHPHFSFTALEVKALTDIMKYAYRMLSTKGRNGSDCDKIMHYARMLSYMARPLPEKATDAPQR